jgi:hypothetical protein
MIGKITFAAAVLGGTAAMAQQSQQQNPTTPGSQPNTQNHPAPNNLSGQCWDMATNQVRSRGTVGAGGNAGNNPGTNPSAPQNQQAPSGSAAQRPAGMTNC